MQVATGDVKVGAIFYKEKLVIGQGSYGTIVYRGTYEKRNVAVKKIPEHRANIAEREKDLLLQIHMHPNIVKCLRIERDHEAYYFALTLCQYTLKEYVKKEFDNLNLKPVILLKEITSGLQFLHENKIIHRDLKPGNILITSPNHVNERSAMIADFGISKQTIGTRESATLTSRDGTEGFIAPEVDTNPTVTNACDIFSLGCVFFYVESHGGKLFASERHLQEKFYRMCIKTLEKPEYTNFCSLVLRMVSLEPTRRPSCKQILSHHIFWDDEKRMRFIQDASDYLRDNKDLQNEFDDKCKLVFGGSWDQVIDNDLVADLVNGKRNQGKRNKVEIAPDKARDEMQKFYNRNKYSDLLRAMRNIFHHFSEIIIKSRQQLSSRERCVQHFLEIFPKLFSFVYDSAEIWKNNEYMEKFYINRTVCIGDMNYCIDSKIKTTSNGMTIFKGQYKHWKAAIKRYPRNSAFLGENKWRILSKIEHPNIVCLFHKVPTHEEDDCLYIAEKLGQYNLFEYVGNSWNNDNPAPIKLLKQITRGLMFLHAKNIIHCNLMPSNILISYPNKLKIRRAMICDFEISEENEEASVSWSHALGKIPHLWRTPELRETETGQFTKSVDIFCLGRIYLYVLSQGSEDVVTLLNSKNALSEQEIAGMDLLPGYSTINIRRMLNCCPELRSIKENVVDYPMFWPLIRRVNFWKAVMDVIKTNDKAEKAVLSNEDVSATDWMAKLDKRLADDIKVRVMKRSDIRNKSKHLVQGLENENSISSLINVVRSIQNTTDMLQTHENLFNAAGGIVQYFYELFPDIPDFLYDVMCPFKDEWLLRIYYSRDATATSNWNHVEPGIARRIVSKLSPQCLLTVGTLSKTWSAMNSNFYSYWVLMSSWRWNRPSFDKAMKCSADCKDIYLKSSEEYQRKTAPTLLLTVNTLQRIHHMSLSEDGKLLAVTYEESIKIYDSTDFTIKFSKDIGFLLHSSSINKTNSMILGNTHMEITIMAIAEGLPILCRSVCHGRGISQPWLTDQIFISMNNEDGATSFWLKNIVELPNSKSIEMQQLQVFQEKGEVFPWKIFALQNSFILIYKISPSKIVVKTFSEEDVRTAEKKFATDAIPDECECVLLPECHEFFVKEAIKDFTLVSDDKKRIIYALADDEERNYWFLTIDLINLRVTPSVILVPGRYEYAMTLQSNDRYIISGNGRSFVCVWDLKSGVCIANLKHDRDLAICAIHPYDSKLVITAGCMEQKLRRWHLNL